MPTVWIVPAGSDSAEGGAPGDYLVRPTDGDLYEVGKLGDACTWIGTLGRDLLPSLPEVDAAQQAPDQDEALAQVRALETAEDLRGG